jgi:hypothetical protein
LKPSVFDDRAVDRFYEDLARGGSQGRERHLVR